MSHQSCFIICEQKITVIDTHENNSHDFLEVAQFMLCSHLYNVKALSEYSQQYVWIFN